MPNSQLPAALDVLVVGGGAAGLYTALCLPPQFQVGLITKDHLSLSASDWAQGGIAAAIAPEDSPALHITDTLRAGAGLCDLAAVTLLVEEAARCVQALVNMGVGFDRQGDQLAMTLEAAHSRRRVLHAADTTGRAMVTTLMAEVFARKNIYILQQAFVLDLWMQDQVCRGASVIVGSELLWLRAGAVILATGGGGQVYAQTTNPAVSTGDGVAMAWRAGAQIRDPEFMQFHPTALTKPGAPRFLISEAVRGEGAHLVDDQGRRFAFDYHPSGELAPRDVVSRAIFNHLEKISADPTPTPTHVWLDLRPIPPESIRHRFPNIIQVCQQWEIDVFQEPIPVAPAAHYWMGGITADTQSRTSIPGLYAVGETASTGVHGANRLASNSLLECLVYGAQFANLTLQPQPPAAAQSERPIDCTLDLSTLQTALQDSLLFDWRQDLARLMWHSAGICRTHAVLVEAITQVEIWQQTFAELPLSQVLLPILSSTDSVPWQFVSPETVQALRQWGELRNLLDIAALILKSAHFRTESRGGHYRDDFPHLDPNWQVHTLIQAQTWSQSALIRVPDNP